MQPDKSDYEIWIADWLAGNLDNDRKKQFEEFLAGNPGLKEEAESLLLTSVIPDNISFPRKNLLKKSPEDFTPSQVEYLSAAYLENDLSPEQIEELNICLAKNPELRILSDSVRKTKLSPPGSRYIFKKNLKKKTRAGRILKLSFIGFGAAASVAILVMSSLFISRQIAEKKNVADTAGLVQQEGLVQPEGQPLAIQEVMTEQETGKQVLQQIQPEGQPLAIQEVMTEQETGKQVLQQVQPEGQPLTIQEVMTKQETGKQVLQQIRPEGQPLAIQEVMTEQETGQQVLQQIRPERQPLADNMRINDLPRFSIKIVEQAESGTLLAVAVPYREPPYDGRNGLTRFLARTFREKILRDDSGSDAPIRAYEVASAGINSISRMFGLGISFTGITDSQGDLKSLYFSSRLVKFNAPVKKEESFQ